MAMGLFIYISFLVGIWRFRSFGFFKWIVSAAILSMVLTTGFYADTGLFWRFLNNTNVEMVLTLPVIIVGFALFVYFMFLGYKTGRSDFEKKSKDESIIVKDASVMRKILETVAYLLILGVYFFSIYLERTA